MPHDDWLSAKNQYLARRARAEFAANGELKSYESVFEDSSPIHYRKASVSLTTLIADLLDQTTSDDRAKAGAARHQIHCYGKKAIGPLIHRLNYGPISRRRTAAYTIGVMRKLAMPAMSALTQASKSNDEKLRRLAIESLNLVQRETKPTAVQKGNRNRRKPRK